MQKELLKQYQSFQEKGLNLDLTRGKPSSEQLDLSNDLCSDSGNELFHAETDLRNYGGIDGIATAKTLGADILQTSPEQVLVGGNSSLSLMYHTVLNSFLYGVDEQQAWVKESERVAFLCPSPGYDRHFTICENLGIDMIAVPMLSSGPDMDRVEQDIAKNPKIRGMWCVPKYSNPTGCIYSDETVERIAQLGKVAHPSFRVLWDNAYAVHDFGTPQPLASLFEAVQRHQTQDSVVAFASTSKITFAGAGISFLASSQKNLTSLKKLFSVMSIGPDKLNQQRHMLFLKNLSNLQDHMKKQAQIIQPKFELALSVLAKNLSEPSEGSWTKPQGGYFISFETLPFQATKVIRLAKDAGVKLTPAGSAFPYKKDPLDTNIRIAPTFATLEDIEQAMEIFTLCVKIALSSEDV